MKNSDDSPRSDAGASWREVVSVGFCASILVGLASWWLYRRGYILYYGDAQAHLNISRSIIDSKTPGYDQLGSVWLPVLHLICLPFVSNDKWWTTGLAGTIPVAACFVVSAVFFYLAAREAYGSMLAAGITVACYTLNPNVLYLGSIPMTEVVFFAAFSTMLFALLRFRRTENQWLVVLAAFASIAASLTRYDGWFLIPFFTAGFFLCARDRRCQTATLFLALASLAPLYWFAHNYWETSDFLSFYRGPYSAKAIYRRALDAGLPRYRGDHEWGYAAGYYGAAGFVCAGWSLVTLGIIGLFFAVRKRRFLPVAFLGLTPAFYIWSMYSSGTPIFLPFLHSQGYYNTRYGIAVLPLAAFAAGAIELAIPSRWQRAALAIPLLAVLPWIVSFSPEHWICWKESQVNSHSRRFWSKNAAEFFTKNYRSGDGLLLRFGDLTAILSYAGIPLKEAIHEGNGPAWLATISRLDLLHRQKWAIAQMNQDDSVRQAIDRANKGHTMYQPVLEIDTLKDPVVRIYRRVE